MALEDIYMATLVQRVSGTSEDLESVFFFEGGGTSPSAIECKAAMLTDADPSFLEDINSLQCTAINNRSIRVINLGDLADFFDDPVTGGGDVAGQMLPIHDALNFSLRLNTRAVRPGSKRFSGIPEAWQDGGVITDSEALGRIDAVGAHLRSILTTAGGATFTPVVVKRVLYDVPDTDPVRQAYRVPQVGDDLVVGTVVAVLTTPVISHQTSRGNGR